MNDTHGASTMTGEENNAHDPAVQRFDPPMIDRLARERNLTNLQKRSDTVWTAIIEHDSIPDLALYLQLTVDANHVYTVRLIGPNRVTPTDWAATIMLCNSWNMERLFPMACLVSSASQTDQEQQGEPFASVVLENALSLEAGISQELLSHFTDITIFAAMDFWRWSRDSAQRPS